MTTIPQVIFLDTNVYLIGVVEIDSAECKILKWLGWESQGNNEVEVVISSELIDQISRVARRLRIKIGGVKLLGGFGRS